MRSAEQKYWLSAHVHVCVTDNYAVLLDLRQDKYIGVGREHLPALADVVAGWPRTSQPEADSVQSSDALLSKLLGMGMLTTDSALGREAQPPSLPRPQSMATVADLERRPPIRVRDVSRVLTAAAKAKLSLKWRPIETVVGRVQARKRERCPTGDFDLQAAYPLVEAFLHLRPLYFTTKDECLFDSLVLVEFLARHGLYPTWVIGVSTNPFKAHSWVQVGDCVLNDLPEYVCMYTPILAI